MVHGLKGGLVREGRDVWLIRGIGLLRWRWRGESTAFALPLGLVLEGSCPCRGGLAVAIGHLDLRVGLILLREGRRLRCRKSRGSSCPGGIPLCVVYLSRDWRSLARLIGERSGEVGEVERLR